MNRLLAAFGAAGVALLASGCATVPETITHQPPPDRPVVQAPRPAASNGAIFQSAGYQPLFEDRRARKIGDIITISITERTTAGKSASSSASKSGSVDAAVPSLFGMRTGALTRGVQAEAESSFADKGAASSSNTFSGTITTTVIDVLPNGNLVVSGEKQIALDKGVEYVRFSGVVSPDTIAAGNVVPSTKVADARIEYRTNTRIDRAEMASQLARFFLSVLPL